VGGKTIKLHHQALQQAAAIIGATLARHKRRACADYHRTDVNMTLSKLVRPQLNESRLLSSFTM